MAIQVFYSEITTPGITPRISFSHDLNQPEYRTSTSGFDLDPSVADSDFDFGIGVTATTAHQVSSADELFFNGKILPIQIRKQVGQWHSHSQSTNTNTNTNTPEKKRLKEFLLTSDFDSDEEEEDVVDQPSSKSFWQFKRSNSLNCDMTRSKSLMRSLHFYSRSNSTGSALNPKPTVLPKESKKQKQFMSKQPSISRKPSVSSSHSHYLQRCKSKNGNGVRVSPVLNFPPTSLITNASVNFFGLGSLFCNGKTKRKNK